MSEPGETDPRAGRSWARSCAWACGIGLVAIAVFGMNLAGEPRFVDESAYLSQSYFADLLLSGDCNSPAWLTYPAVDLPPLPKCLIGVALRAGSYPRPGPEIAQDWYFDTSLRVGTPEMLEVARVPSVLLGSVGCVALFAIGCMGGGRRMGVVAAFFLMLNPLYSLHARRAMADVPAEAFILASAAVALWGWQHILGRGGWLPPVLAGLVSGVLGGLAVLCKLNGGLALMIIAAWAILAAALPKVSIGRKLGVAAMALLTGLVAFATFVALNPYLRAHPTGPLPAPISAVAKMGLWERTREVLRHRIRVSAEQKLMFPHNALNSPQEKLEVVIVQGFGRFGLFGSRSDDSTRRFDWSQDAGALLWLPLVVAGTVWALLRGRRQVASGEPPTAWAIVIQALVALSAVTAYLPLAWNRYFLSLQPGSALLAAGAIEAAAEGLTALFRGRLES
jgi:4-amino-4-deoxy-L-arabinose transferase-like glycosyltransferase